MNFVPLVLVLGVAALVGARLFVRVEQAGGADRPPTTFSKDVQPFLRTYCLRCHSGPKPKGSINLESYDDIVNGGKALIKAGRPDDSRLCQVSEGKGKPMPPKEAKQPTSNEAAVIRSWIAAGARDN